MADLITHTCAAVLWKVATRRPDVAVFVVGTCMPDLLGRVPNMALTVLRWKVPAVPEWLLYAWNVAHMPAGIVLTSYVLAFLFREARRRVVFVNLLGGGMLHLAVDLTQSHYGVGYHLLFPFSMWDFELGWIGSETTVLILPALLPFTVAVAWWRWGRRG